MGRRTARTYAPTRRVRSEYGARIVQLVAVVCVGAYVSWRAAGSWRGADLIHFLVVFGCEILALAALVPLVCLPRRIPKSRRPSTSLLPTVDAMVCIHGKGLHLPGSTLMGRSQAAGSPRHSTESDLGFEDLWHAVGGAGEA